MRSMPRLQVPALPVRPVVDEHPTAALIAVPYDNTGTSIVHGVGVAAIQRGGNVVGDDRRVKIVPRAFPDTRVIGQRFHAMPIAGMVAADLTEWIRSRGLQRFSCHSRCGHPTWVPPALRKEAAKP